MEIGTTFCGRTDGRTDGRTHLSSNLLGHRRGDDLKIWPEFECQGQGHPGQKKRKSVAFCLGVVLWSAVLHQFYASGKMSTCCLVVVIIIIQLITQIIVKYFNVGRNRAYIISKLKTFCVYPVAQLCGFFQFQFSVRSLVFSLQVKILPSMPENGSNLT